MFYLEYYKIERAAKLLDCEIDDIVHLWLMGYISLSIELKSLNTTLSRYEIADKNERELLKAISGDLYSHTNYKNDNKIFYYEELIESFETDNDGFCRNVYSGIAYGIWRIIPTIITKFVEEYIYLFNPRGERRIPESYCSAVIYGEHISGVGMDEILLNEIMKVSKKEFIIMKDDLIKVQNIGSGDFKYQDEVKDKENDILNITDFDENKLATKTLNSRAEFIKALLTIMYGEDVSGNPRKHIDSDNGEIRKDFIKSNLSLPNGKTVQKWVDSVDLSYQES